MDKYSSRKFILALIVTIAFIVLESAAFAYGFINKDYKWACDMAPFVIYAVAVYVTGNVAQDFSPLSKETKSSGTKK